MNSTTRSHPRYLRGFLAVALGLAATTSKADLFVNLSQTPLGGGTFQYEYSVSNTGLDDVAIVSITDAPLGDSLISASLTVPAGFLSSYDSGLGIVDFLGNTSLFAAGSTTGGFLFQSTSQPPDYFIKFEALTVQGEFISGTVNSVPETTSTVLMEAFGVFSLVLAHRKIATH